MADMSFKEIIRTLHTAEKGSPKWNRAWVSYQKIQERMDRQRQKAYKRERAAFLSYVE